MNKVELVGHLGRDAELRYTPRGKAVLGFSMATRERRKDDSGEWRDEAEWHNVVVWGNEGVAPYLKKGTQVAVVGRLRTRNWEQDGVKRYMTEVVADMVGGLELLGQPKNGGGAESGASQRASRKPQSEPPGGWPGAVDEDDLPF